VTWWQTISNWISTLNVWLKALFALMTAGASALAAWKWVIPPIRKILRLGN
jgi:HAMP domain-containing protein